MNIALTDEIMQYQDGENNSLVKLELDKNQHNNSNSQEGDYHRSQQKSIESAMENEILRI